MPMATTFELQIEAFWNKVLWVLYLLGCFCPWISFTILGWTCYHRTLLYVRFIFSNRIFYKGVPSFASDCACGGVWSRGLTCLLYVGRSLKIGFKWIHHFQCFWFSFCKSICIYFNISWYDLTLCSCLHCFRASNSAIFLSSTTVLSLSIDVVLRLSIHQYSSQVF